jgi:hypothetical protein
MQAFEPVERLPGFRLSKWSMTKEKLIGIIRTSLKTNADLRFLLQLKEKELDTLVACIRQRIHQVGK